MPVPPEGAEWSPQWITWGIGVFFSIISGIATGSYFVGATRKEIESLKDRVAEAAEHHADLKNDMRQIVHDLRNEMHKINSGAAKVGDTQRIEAHLARQDERFETRFNQVMNVILNGRSPSGSA